MLSKDIEFDLNPKIKVIVFDFSFFNSVSSLFKLNRLIYEYKIDKIITFLYKPSFITIFAKILFQWKVSIVVSERTYTLSHYSKNTIKGVIGISLIKVLYNQADLIIPNSKLTEFSLRHHLKIRTPIITLYNPVEKPKKLNNNSDLDSKTLRILNVGNNFLYKDQFTLIESLFFLKDLDWRLSIIGIGPLNEVLKKNVIKFGLENKIEFLGNVNACNHYSNYDLFISTSLIEGFPNVIVEAMMFGLAIISTDCKSGPREILAPNSPCTDTYNTSNIPYFADYGVLIPLKNSFVLSETIKTFLCDFSLLLKYKKVASQRSLDFESEKIVKEFVNILENEQTN